jgi:hypothetical protein
MIPKPTNLNIEKETEARRRRILGMLPSRMLDGMCDLEPPPGAKSSGRSFGTRRAFLLDEALKRWEDNDRVILEYLDRAFDGRLDITY